MAKTASIKSGSVVVSEGSGETASIWTMTPEQAEKHLPTFAAQPQKLAAGDVSAIQDAARDYKAARALDEKNL